jgi:hypothetical protein
VIDLPAIQGMPPNGDIARDLERIAGDVFSNPASASDALRALASNHSGAITIELNRFADRVDEGKQPFATRLAILELARQCRAREWESGARLRMQDDSNVLHVEAAFASDRPDCRSLREWASDAELLKPPVAVLPYLGWKSRLTVLAGREKLGKSSLTGEGAARISRGADFLGEQCTAGEVLIISLEEFIGDTVQRLLSFDADMDCIHISTSLPKRGHDLAGLIEAIRPDLVILDTLAVYAESLVTDANSAAQWAPVMMPLARLAHDSGAAIIAHHHAKKSDGKFRDSTAIAAAADVLVELTEATADQLRKDPTIRLLSCKGRFPTRNATVRLADHSYRVCEDSSAVSLDLRVIELVRANPGSSATRIVTGIGVRKETVLDSIRQLEIQGRLLNTGTGKRASYEVVECA